MTMDRMSGADAMMLYLDRAEAYNHTIKLQIIDPRDDPAGWCWKRFKAAWASAALSWASAASTSRCETAPSLRRFCMRV